MLSHEEDDSVRSHGIVVVTTLIIVVLWGGVATVAVEGGDYENREVGESGAVLKTTTAASTTRPVNPQATYLHTVDDNADDPEPILLSEIGVEPGDTVRLERLGEFESPESNEQNIRYGLIGVFSSNSTLLPPSRQHRVPGAIDAGDDFTTSPTFFGDEETDIPEDFQISTLNASSNSTVVTVPADARYLFLTPQDNYFQENSDSDRDFEIRIAEVNERPQAQFTFSPSNPSAGEQVTFDASNSTDSDGSIVEYRWDFQGDGTIDNVTADPVTTHTYGSQGSYTIELTVEDDDGATARAFEDIGVEPGAPTARCSVTPDTVTVNETVTIDASNSTNADSFVYDYEGDGEPNTDRITDATVTTSYQQPDTYTPVVTVYNDTTGETDTAECNNVTVTEENQRPTARFSVSPRPAVAGERTTLDASNSTDPDGTIDRYEWDFDGDGTVDNVATDPVTTHVFQYNATGPGFANVVLEVMDDGGRTDTTGEDLEIVRREEVTARCSVFPDEIASGNEITIDASDSINAETYRYDVDGDGNFDTDRLGQSSLSRPLEEPGSYTPRVEGYGPNGERTDTARCGSVVVRAENQPPVAAFTTAPRPAAVGGATTLNATNSTDPDGTIVVYRWDLDNDGTFERNTSRPVITHTFGSTGNHSVGLMVVDNDGATARTQLLVRVQPGGPSVPFPWWLLAGIAGGGAGYLVCRGRDIDIHHLPKPWGSGGGSGSGITARATGTFETPTDSGTVTVDGLGFEPDLLLFTASNDVQADSDSPSRTDGWTYGKALRNPDGSITQNAVSVASDAQQTESGVAAARTDASVDLLVQDNEGADGLLGTVQRTTTDGFEIRFDGSALADEHAADSYVVLFQAFETASDANAAVGHFLTPEQATGQTVDLGIDADYVQLTAIDPLGKTETAQVTGGWLGVSHGAATSEASIGQHAITGAVGSSAVGRNSHAAFEDRSIHLLHGKGSEIDGRTSARVTGLGEQLELTYDEVYTPNRSGTAGRSDAAPASDGGSDASGTQPPAAAQRLVTFVAVDTGDGPSPAVGHFDPSAPGEDPQWVDTGFEPAVVEFTAGTATAVGTERTVVSNPLSFGWSHGTAMIGGDGTVDHHVLHSSVGVAEVSGTGPVETPTTRTPRSGTPQAGARASTDGGAPAVASARNGTGAIGFVLDDDGRILARDEVRVTGVDGTGFAVETERVGGAGIGTGSELPVVFYTAWPRIDQANASDTR